MSTRYDYVILKEKFLICLKFPIWIMFCFAFVIKIFRKTVWYFFGPIMHSFINQAKQGQTVYRKLCMYKNGKTNWQMMKIRKKEEKGIKTDRWKNIKKVCNITQQFFITRRRHLL